MASLCLVVDEHKNPIGAKLRADRLPTDHFVFVMVFVRTSAGKYLFQRRRKTALTFPNKLDASASGFIKANETGLHTAYVELYEAIGISGYWLRHVCDFHDINADGTIRDFGEVYELTAPFTGQVHFIPGEELDEVLELAPEEALAMMARTPDDFTTGCIRGFKQFQATLTQQALLKKITARRKARSPIRFPQSPPTFGWAFALIALGFLVYYILH